VIDTATAQFGKDCDLYAFGYSLGSSSLLRHLGSSLDDNQSCGLKAATVVSAPFDLCSTGIELQTSAFGIYDYLTFKGFRSHFDDRELLMSVSDEVGFNQEST